MRIRLLLLFFLIPSLIHADFHPKDYRRSNDKLFSEWQKAKETILQSNNCGSNDQKKAADLFEMGQQFLINRSTEGGWNPEGYRMWLMSQFPITFERETFDDDYLSEEEISNIRHPDLIN